MAVVSIDAGRDGFRTRGRSDGSPGQDFDRESPNYEDENIVPDPDDQARFARLVLPHLGDAYSLARWITGSRADAEDVVQESLVRALQTWPYYGIPNNPAAWLTQTAKHLALDLIRREKSFRDKQTEIILSVTPPNP